MKRIIALFCTALIMLLVSITAFAGDPTYLMMHANDMGPERSGQYAMIVGQLVEKKDDKYSVNVLKVLNGKVNSEIIMVDSNFKYGWAKGEEQTPKVNDYCVMSLKKSGNNYKQAYGVFKADSGNFSTLKLVTGPSSFSHLACIEWYVNSGGTEYDFFFEESKAFVNRPNGERLQIYPKPVNESPHPTLKPDENASKGINLTGITGLIKTNPGLAAAIPVGAFAVVIAVVLILRLNKRR